MTQENSPETPPLAQEQVSDKFNTAAGWVLFAAGLGLGLSILSDKYFHGYDPEMPENPGYAIAEPEGASEGEAEVTIAQALNETPMEELVAKGEQVFAKCQACHSIAAGGPNGVGPNLHGVMGAAYASKPGFNYSSALKSASGTWGWEEMNKWLLNPKRFIDGTSMSFAGLSKIEDRAAVSAYLNANGGGLAIPEYTPPAADEAEVEGEAEGAAEAEAEQDAAAEIEEATAE